MAHLRGFWAILDPNLAKIAGFFWQIRVWANPARCWLLRGGKEGVSFSLLLAVLLSLDGVVPGSFDRSKTSGLGAVSRLFDEFRLPTAD